MHDTRQSLSAKRKLVYAHDPMCSLCWGFNSTYQDFLRALPKSIEVVRLLGGLAPDTSEPMTLDMRNYLQQTWKKIAEIIPGTHFNHQFWTSCQPRRSTWPACRAVIAARQQGLEFDTAMTTAIQEGYYLHAKNPSDDTTLIGFAADLGLDELAFAEQLNSESTRQQLRQEIGLTRQLGVQGFPSLVSLDGDLAKPIQISYTDAEAMLVSVKQE